jgi:hypothetical protein
MLLGACSPARLCLCDEPRCCQPIVGNGQNNRASHQAVSCHEQEARLWPTYCKHRGSCPNTSEHDSLSMRGRTAEQKTFCTLRGACEIGTFSHTMLQCGFCRKTDSGSEGSRPSDDEMIIFGPKCGGVNATRLKVEVGGHNCGGWRQHVCARSGDSLSPICFRASSARSTCFTVSTIRQTVPSNSKFYCSTRPGCRASKWQALSSVHYPS